MYIQSIELENTGPIKHADIKFPKNKERPQPVIIVGENGSGKSILLSHIVNSLIIAKQQVFEDSEVEKGRVFKLRSGSYVRSGEDYYTSKIVFDNGLYFNEFQYKLNKKDFEENLSYCPLHKEWKLLKDDSSSFIDHNFNTKTKEVTQLIGSNCIQYFPVNRFEEPAWLNVENLSHIATYTDLKNISGFSNRDILSTSPLKKNINWLIDIIFDRATYELITETLDIPENDSKTIFRQHEVVKGYSGKSTSIYDSILSILKTILQKENNIRLGVGLRKARRVSVVKDEQTWIPNLFQLSTGEMQLLNIFCSIIRDYDLSSGQGNDISEISGIVIIDEIDAHLHTKHQKEILPKLISSFPNIQFIITSHSPLFLIGMNEQLGKDNFSIFELPSGNRVFSDEFSEFKAAYNSFKETTHHRHEITEEIKRSSNTILFVEGDYDIKYLKKASKLLEKEHVISKFRIMDGTGYGNLDKIWRLFDNPISSALNQKIVLLYDCDTNAQNKNRDMIFKRIIPANKNNPIKKGIENLFSEETINKAERFNANFIDFTEEHKKTFRGITTIEPSKKSVNIDEKGNLCNWICENGEKDDFLSFDCIFEILEQIPD